MNWLAIVISVLVFGVISICFFTDFHSYYSDVGETISEILLTVLVSGTLAVLICLIPFLVSLPRGGEWVVVEKHSEVLVQAQVNNKIEGQWGIFYGRLDDNDVYRFYVKTSDGYRMNYIYTDSGRIVETDETPRVEFYDRLKLNSERNWWQRNFFTETYWDRLCTKKRDHMGVLYIPRGTIIQNKFDNMNL